MGWIREDSASGCEGFLVACVHLLDRDGRELVEIYRELSYPLDDQRRTDIRSVAAGCECGWRSSHWRPEHGGSWSPFSFFGNEKDEDRAADLWDGHVKARVLEVGRWDRDL